MPAFAEQLHLEQFEYLQQQDQPYDNIKLIGIATLQSLNLALYPGHGMGPMYSMLLAMAQVQGYSSDSGSL